MIDRDTRFDAIAGEELIAHIAQLELAVGTARDLQTIYRALYAFAANAVPCNGLYVSRFDPATQLRTCVYAVAEGEEQDVTRLPPMPMTNSPQSSSVRTGEVIISDDFQSAIAGQPVVNLGLERDPTLPQSSVAVPMKVLGRTIGAFEVQSTLRAAYRRHHAVLLQMAGNLCAIATENVRLLNEEQRLRHDAETSERRFRALIEHSADAMVGFSADGHFVYVSPGATRILGYAKEEFLRMNAFQLVHPEDEASLRAFLARVAHAKDLQYAEFRVLHRDGTWRWLSGTAQNLLEMDAVHALVGNFQDVTERKQAEEQLRQMQKMESVGQLAGGVAHDFNNILTVIQARTSLLLQMAPSPDELRESLTEIHQAAQRAARLTQQLLAFSRKQSMTVRSLDLNEVVRAMDGMLKRILGEDIRLEVQCGEIGRIDGDASMMEQVLMNLAANARDAMPRGGVLRTKTFRWFLTAEQQHRAAGAAIGAEFVCLSVADTGDGIQAEHLPRIFDPFFTTKDIGKGTGLGLATVYGIVQQHRGWIDVCSQPRCGAEFRVMLPVSAAAPAPRAIKPSRVCKQLPQGTETVLVVEDDTTVRAMVKSVLEACGYHVLEAANGPEAFACWREARDRIDLVLTDMIMPEGVTGGELGARFIADKPSVRVIYTSGYSPRETGKATVVPAADFLPKPYDATTLARCVRERLDAAAT